MILECVPNISEGCDAETIAAIARAIESVSAVNLLHYAADPDHNRTVYTFAGGPSAVAQAAFLAVKEAHARINLSRHTGVHPRVGAADVVPFAPVHGMTLQQVAALARDFGARVWEELGIPVFLYEAAAFRDEYRQLEQLRKFIPQGLPPDFGDGMHPTAGVTCVGARKFLIAWNVNLKTTDLGIAKQIAKEIRQSSGGIRGVKALGISLASRNQVQVSMNIVDFEKAPLHLVFASIAEKCRLRGVEIAGSELIGLIPEAALLASRGYDLRWENLTEDSVLENRMAGSVGWRGGTR